jgi:hypothetical protein
MVCRNQSYLPLPTISVDAGYSLYMMALSSKMVVKHANFTNAFHTQIIKIYVNE